MSQVADIVFGKAIAVIGHIEGHMNCQGVEDFMSDQPKKPEPGTLLIDARPLEGILVDYQTGKTRGVTRAQAGFDEAVLEIVANQPQIGVKIGILQSQIDELEQLNQRIALVTSYLPAVKKLAEMLSETQSLLDDRRHDIIRVVAKTVEAQAVAMKDDSLLGKYENMRKYRSAIAIKAAKTRKKNAAATSQPKTAE